MPLACITFASRFHAKVARIKSKTNQSNQTYPIMKKFFYTLAFALVTMVAVSSCTDDNITPADGGGTQSDKCQFGGPGCPKN
jgi:hypothetical protein